ncbi:CYTH and CHAD domain-containing protein [Streptomyces lunaelactis]|uniref:CYTH and CHAD domain-containing protein n=1 Tax=Streptomyces lunaelactis TaxID=1535768 RepID=UPI00158527DF|nr:CYTH and CHAD domain-containing protein [Streptomyces lunaelactis]NUK35852.1 CYTH and CHAD domain-containing protein [Streptomyces lunaelactis]NUK42668.1 CYTH and CHAD domain-containing protein [Streptomyces lunaelactis]NUK93200.1 CYTH and CHAD domain-containing protein [Streptomyces lunaelactis]NUL28652.1 CYTH and CHAD domain-containing protein [Streptomyces lunaelactis]
MADTKREIERKYEATPETRLPDLTKVPGVSAVVDKGVAELDAVYYDTADLRLAAASITLRHRTGGADAGWHLKLPVAPGVRDEISAPLSEPIPRTLAALVRARTRDAELVPVVRLLSSRDVRHLVDADGALLAELSRDAVRAERLTDGGRTAQWDEIEVELADDADPAFLDAVEKKLRKAGVLPAESPSKLARALAETAPKGERARKAVAPPEHAPRTAGEHILAYLREQADALISYDPAVRRDLPDSVHQMRVATRRMRSAFKTYGKVVDRSVTDPIGEELKWLAAELGVARDQEVLTERLKSRIDSLPRTLLLGPVRGRLRLWSVAHGSGARRKAVAVLDSKRYLALLESLDALLADPPLLKAASGEPSRVIPKAVLKDYDRLAARTGHALELPPGEARDLAMHDARKAAKRARYAGEAATPPLGKAARNFARRMKAVQTVLGDHQDSVVAREALRNLAIQAHAAGESAFSWGLLYGHEEAQAAEREAELPGVWAKASAPKLRADLTG